MFVLLFTSFWMPAPFLPFGYDTEYIWLFIVVYSLIPTGVFIEEQWYNIKFGGENNHKILDLWIKSYEYTQNICLLNKNYLPCLHCIIEEMLLQKWHTYIHWTLRKATSAKVCSARGSFLMSCTNSLPLTFFLSLWKLDYLKIYIF